MPEPAGPMDRARRGPKGNVDRFLALWLNLLVEGKQTGSSPAQIRKTLARFMADADVAAARESAGDATFADELSDAARTYFDACRTDPGYSTTMFRTKPLEPDRLQAKAARDAAHIIGALARGNALQGFTERLPSLVARGFIESFGPDSETALRTAVGKDPEAARLAPLVWD